MTWIKLYWRMKYGHHWKSKYWTRLGTKNLNFRKLLVVFATFAIIGNGLLSAYVISSPFYYMRRVQTVDNLQAAQFTNIRADGIDTRLNSTRRYGSSTQKQLTSLCPNITSLHEQDESIYEGLACQPRPPSKESCEYTAEKFKLTPSILKCKDQDEPPYVLCNLQNNTDLSTRVKVTCDLSVCDVDRDVLIEEPDPSDGELKDEKVNKDNRASNEKFAKLVEKALLRARENNLNFVFLNCTRKGTENRTISQMISVLPKLQYVKSTEKKPHGGKLNVNILLLDSISRAHFYRSFPKTVQYLREKRENRNPKAASFFEFQFYQAIHGHTHENENALFSGDLYPENYTEKQINSAPTSPQIMYGIFKEAGYQTMYLEDQCWKGNHGIRDSLKARTLKRFQDELKTSNIDSTGITHSSCKILLQSGSKIHQFFVNEHNQVCYNGRHHHEYILNYLTRYIKTVQNTPQRKPLFSYTALNVAHDNVGLRVQTLDQHLMEFIDTMSRQEDTVTFVLADHGNTYTRYQIKMLEGRLEMYHPMMLGVIPYKVGQSLGNEALKNLQTNQHRLFNLLDLRAGLVEVSKYDGAAKFRPTGLLGKISKDRVCKDLKLTKSSICICDGWYVPVKNTTTQLLIAEFAVGQLNNKIQDLLMKSRKEDVGSDRTHFLFGYCQRLRIQSFTNMREQTIEQVRISATMDITIQSGNIINQDEVFTVNVQYKTNDKYSYEMKLVSFERISTYGIYEQCADPNVELQLCVCNKRNSSLPRGIEESSKLDILQNKTHPIYDIIGKSDKIKKLNSCLILIQRSLYGKKIRKNLIELKTFDIANICNDQSFSVHVNAAETKSKSGVSSSVKLPLIMTIPPRQLYFVTVLIPEDARHKPELNLDIRIAKPKTENPYNIVI